MQAKIEMIATSLKLLVLFSHLNFASIRDSYVSCEKYFASSAICVASSQPGTYSEIRSFQNFLAKIPFSDMQQKKFFLMLYQSINIRRLFKEVVVFKQRFPIRMVCLHNNFMLGYFFSIHRAKRCNCGNFYDTRPLK